jgi:hypothetical protein
MRGILFSIVVLFQQLSGLQSSSILENNRILFEFDQTNGAIIHQIDKLTNIDLLATPSSSISSEYPFWEISFVDNFGEIVVTNVKELVNLHSDDKSNLMELEWKNISIQRKNKNLSTVDVIIHLELPEDSSTASLSIFVHMIDGSPLGIWQVRVSIPYTVGSNEDGQLFFPSGFGTTYVDPVVNAASGVNSLYPGSYAAMQYLALGSGSSAAAGYFAAHDPNGSPKLIEYSNNALPEKKPLHLSSVKNWESDELLNPKASLTSEDFEAIQSLRSPLHNEPILSFLRITIYPENAGVALPIPSTWKSAYPLAVGIVTDISASDNRPMWYEAAQLYRQWVLSSAEWTKAGPLSTRTTSPPLPSWYRQNHLWINSHWQCHDIFNETGGDPHFILQNTKQIAELFDQKSLALHWYEWQQGPDPSPEGRYKFDTHYPDYFPPRDDFFGTVSSLLEENGIYTFPYINGRIFDINSDSYLKDTGELYCAKKTDEKIIRDEDSVANLESYIETYGSDASFCVANPSTPYWQEKVAEVVDELVNKYQVSGVYIDQIGQSSPLPHLLFTSLTLLSSPFSGAAVPKLCWDSSHGHTLGGGVWWREGYIQMLQSIATKTTAPMVTEDTAEPYMDSLHGYLTLVAFKSSLVVSVSNGLPSPSSTNYRIISPAFPAIYGGYYVGFGAQWYQLDFQDHDWWCGKLAATFVTGTQMGWFSLLGISDDPLDSCGNMALNELLTDEESSDLIDFLKKLTKQRDVLVDYFIDGHLIRSVGMNPLPQIQTQTISSGGYPLLDYQTISTASWRLDSMTHGRMTMTVLVNSVLNSFETTLQVNFQNWGYDDKEELEVYQLKSNGERVYLATLQGPTAQLPIVIPERNVIALEFQPSE